LTQQRQVRPRYGRIAAAGSAAVVTLVTLLGGLGVLPDGRGAAEASAGAATDEVATLSSSTPASTPALTPASSPAADPAEPTSTPSVTTAPVDTALPDDTGRGRRVVFDMSEQRVWLVDDDGGEDAVERTYLVSGSLTDNLDPGTYGVYSRSRWAVGIDDSGVMEYFVRFTRGAHAAIGFHSIPTKDERPLQTTGELGTPQSHGCLRQALSDARRLWNFAPVGTKVVVTA
jgi:hypothetical protein